MTEFKYMSGFGNEFATEAIPGTLPERGNNPQRPAYGLYAEQISGSAFTAPRSLNRRSWLYRILPSVRHSAFSPFTHAAFDDRGPIVSEGPNQMRWDPTSTLAAQTDFIQGLFPFCENGSADDGKGLGIYFYAANHNMEDTFFYSADGELMFVPQDGNMRIETEMGVLELSPLEIAVIPRGIKFRIMCEGEIRGYLCENHGQPFVLPELGPIGANGLANPRDFQTPAAHYVDEDGDFKLICKYGGKLWQAEIDHNPLNVVGWHGNYAPYKYDLRKFNTINTVSFDHTDPSIFTVLTAPSHQKGTANVDFVIFPPRWMVAEDTFRPPYFHRNAMSEFMGLIGGVYDGKEGGGFMPGGASLHNRMSAHGPDAETVKKAEQSDSAPQKIEGAYAFMWESCYPLRVTKAAYNAETRQRDYHSAWKDIQNRFKPPSK
tara:strand:+ start:696 stop:1991 length:1296 start_codon:yes stop_codon:yes gene_type:complete